MSDNLNNTEKYQVLLIGSGYMAREYMKVLARLKCNIIVVGRGIDKLLSLEKEYPQFIYFSGGLQQYLLKNSQLPLYAINAASISELRSTSILLLEHGIKYLLLEKPGDLSVDGLKKIKRMEKRNEARVFIAYNRRFYSSVLTLKKEVLIDGGIISAHFEFTEWVHTIDPKIYDSEVLKKWIISNSSHVIDTVFSLIGIPKELNASVHGQNMIAWHPSGSIFTGTGISVAGIPFTYHSNWEGPGRWAIEISTRKRRFYLKPMEKLLVQNTGCVQINEFLIDDQLDMDFKPGLFLQTKSFLQLQFDNLVSIKEQVRVNQYYDRIGGY